LNEKVMVAEPFTGSHIGRTLLNFKNGSDETKIHFQRCFGEKCPRMSLRGPALSGINSAEAIPKVAGNEMTKQSNTKCHCEGV